MFETFYNETIRNTVVGFGSLFNEIYVSRKDSSGNETSRFKVPITYGPKEKFIRMLNEYSGLKGTANEYKLVERRISQGRGHKIRDLFGSSFAKDVRGGAFVP